MYAMLFHLHEEAICMKRRGWRMRRGGEGNGSNAWYVDVLAEE